MEDRTTLWMPKRRMLFAPSAITGATTSGGVAIHITLQHHWNPRLYQQAKLLSGTAPSMRGSLKLSGTQPSTPTSEGRTKTAAELNLGSLRRRDTVPGVGCWHLRECIPARQRLNGFIWSPRHAH